MTSFSDEPNAAPPVGYGQPPKRHQIKPNEVRNPWGRKGKPRPETDFLDEPFKLRFDGKIIRATRDLAIDFALFNSALKGNVSAAKELKLRKRDRAQATGDAGNEELAAEAKAALDRMIERKCQAMQDACKEDLPTHGRTVSGDRT